MRRLRTSLLVPAMVFAGGLVGSPMLSLGTSTAAAAGPVSICVVLPTGGCVPVPCPPRIFCPRSASTAAVRS